MSFEWVLQIKRPGRKTGYNQYPSTKMKDQSAVTAVTVLLLLCRRSWLLWQFVNRGIL